MRSSISILCLALSLPAGAMTVAELQTQIAKGARLTVVDIRLPALFAASHIPGAINVPASLCPHKSLPPLGKVIVCGSGLGGDAAASALAALNAKSGITAEALEGGFAAWETAHAPSTATAGLKQESLNYVSYAELKAAAASDVVLVDLRKQPAAQTLAASGATASSSSQPLTDLAQEFPGMRLQVGLPTGVLAKSSSPAAVPPLLVLIDSGDGVAETIARRLKAGGNHRYAILAGGELVVSRHGQTGLQRAGSKPTFQIRRVAPSGTTP